MSGSTRREKMCDLNPRVCLFFTLVLFPAFVLLAIPVCAQNNISQFETGQVLLERQGENLSIHLTVDSYSLRASKLGDLAPEGSIFFVIRGALTNKSMGERTSVPEVQKAFFLRMSGNDKIYLDPISEDTADPFWGPQILYPNETLPFEMVFVLPAKEYDEVSLMHLSSGGPIEIFIIGEGPQLPSKYLANPQSKGDAQIGIERMRFVDSHEGEEAPKGWHYAVIDYWFTNLRPMRPLETYLAELIVLVEDGRHVYSPIAEARTEENPIEETFYAQEPTAGNIIFLIPKETGDLMFVHFTEAGPLQLDLTPDIAAPEPDQPVVGSIGEGLVKILLYEESSRLLAGPSDDENIVVLDAGFQLNHDDAAASFELKPTTQLELYDGQGRVYKPVEVIDLRRPMQRTMLFRDQIARGQVAFKVPYNSSDFELVIPFAAGPTKLPVPERLLTEDSDRGEMAAGGQTKTEPKASDRTESKPPESLFETSMLSALSGGATASSTSSSSTKSIPAAPMPRREEPPQEKVTPVSKSLTPLEAIKNRGYERIILVEKPEGGIVVIGSVASDADVNKIKTILSQYSKINEIKMHVYLQSVDHLHPRTLREQTQAAMVAAGLSKIQVRSRKREELILVGTVDSENEEELALSIARVQPGITTVVNNLRK